jgi:dihydrofolate synthase / folylpolyglutamate synthase
MSKTRVFNTLDEWLSWLETLSPREIDLGLERVLEVSDRLRLQKPARVVHVAGTNGKGSSAAMLEALFLQAGFRVGCYTSPHVTRYNERIRLDGVAASDADIIAAFETVEAVRQEVPLTYFEYGTLAALAVFDRHRADTLVLEIGMGGRLDAVNAVEPNAGLITNVTLDHCEWLGPDVDTIAREKAGIMRAGRPLIFGATEVPPTIIAEAARVGADLRIAGRDFTFEDTRDGWSWAGRGRRLEGLRKPALFGQVQLQNAAGVLAVVEAMQLEELLTRQAIGEAFGHLELPGRFQRIEAGRTWLLDVAHNPDAARVLGTLLTELAPSGPVTAVVGVLADKDVAGIIGPLVQRVDRWVAVKAASPRAIEPRRLAQSIANASVKPCLVMEAPAEALEYLDRQLPQAALVLVTGSFYTVGPALAWLEDRRRR